MTDDQATGQSRGVSRRDFLRASGMAVAGAALAPRLIAAQKTGIAKVKSLPTPGRTPKGSIPHRQFWLDEAGPPGARSIHHVYAPVEKVKCHFEDGGAALPNTSISDLIVLDDGSYRAYATAYSVDEKTMRVAVWESGDAINWSARRLGQAPVDGRDTNLIQFDNLPGDQSSVAGPQVMRLPDGRWRMYFWKHGDGHLRYLIAESKDGLRWRVLDVNRPALYHPSDGGLWKLAEGLDLHETVKLDLPPDQVLARKRLWSNDSANVCYNDQLGRFECYSVWLHPAIAARRVDVDNAPGIHRIVSNHIAIGGIISRDVISKATLPFLPMITAGPLVKALLCIPTPLEPYTGILPIWSRSLSGNPSPYVNGAKSPRDNSAHLLTIIQSPRYNYHIHSSGHRRINPYLTI